jgi:hypothetical protein
VTSRLGTGKSLTFFYSVDGSPVNLSAHALAPLSQKDLTKQVKRVLKRQKIENSALSFFIIGTIQCLTPMLGFYLLNNFLLFNFTSVKAELL